MNYVWIVIGVIVLFILAGIADAKSREIAPPGFQAPILKTPEPTVIVKGDTQMGLADKTKNTAAIVSALRDKTNAYLNEVKAARADHIKNGTAGEAAATDFLLSEVQASLNSQNAKVSILNDVIAQNQP